VIGALLSAAVAAAFFGLSRWGRRHADELVPAHYSPERRAREERSLRRGAKSVLAIGILFAVFSLVLAVAAVSDEMGVGSA
jgi:uncharacterized iron-regulated membrane protein